MELTNVHTLVSGIQTKLPALCIHSDDIQGGDGESTLAGSLPVFVELLTSCHFRYPKSFNLSSAALALSFLPPFLCPQRAELVAVLGCQRLAGKCKQNAKREGEIWH